MKKFVGMALLMLSAFCVLPSCNKEQTGLSVENIPGKAKITGTLYIDYGQTYVDGKVVSRKVPAADVEVIVKLDNSDLVNTSKGYTDYKIKTNANGEYTVNIPAVDEGVDVTVTSPDVLGVRSYLRTFENGNMIFDDNKGVFSFSKTVSSVKPGNVKIVDGVFSFTSSTQQLALSEFVDFRVNVGVCLPVKTKQTLSEYQTSGNYSYNGTIVPGNGVNVILSVRYSDTGYTDRNYLYAATTDANGVAVVSIPCTSRKNLSNASFDLQIPRFLGKDDFKYFAPVYDYSRGRYSEGSAVIPAGKYAYRLYTDNCSSYYDFEFFDHSAKALLSVDTSAIDEGADNGVLTRIDTDASNDATYTDYYVDLYSRYSSFWTLSKFITE